MHSARTFVPTVDHRPSGLRSDRNLIAQESWVDGSIIGVDPGEYCAWGFCNLVVNSWMRIGPVRGLSAKR